MSSRLPFTVVRFLLYSMVKPKFVLWPGYPLEGSSVPGPVEEAAASGEPEARVEDRQHVLGAADVVAAAVDGDADRVGVHVHPG
jgi:hypothetical protein